MNTPEEDLEKAEKLVEKQEAGEFEDSDESFILCFVNLEQGPLPHPVVKGEDVSWVKDLLEKQVELHEKLEDRGE